MIYEAIDTWNSPSLEHHGVKGMKWGVRKKVVKAIGKAGKGATKGVFNAQKYFYNRGKKVDRKSFGNGRGVSAYESLIGYGAVRAGRGFAMAAKSRYIAEKASGLYYKPSKTTVGLAAASMVLGAYGDVLMIDGIINSASVRFYEKHKNDKRFTGK